MALYIGSTKIPQVRFGINAAGITLQEKEVTPTKNQQIIDPDSSYAGLLRVTVNPIPNNYIIPAGTLNVTTNNMTIDVTQYSSATINIPTATVNNQEKTVVPSTLPIEVTPDTNYTGLSKVTVTAMPTGSAVTPATTITATPTISVGADGKITASVSTSKSITPTVTAGYISIGIGGNVTASGSATQQLTTLGATTYTPGTSNQTITSGKYLTGVQTIKGDSNLVAGNIKSGISIFGVTGSYSGAGLSLTSATITPSESVQTATPGTGYDGLSSVTVNAIPSDYIGSAITTRSSSDVSISGASISVPAGYYSTAVSKSVSTGSASTPASTITANPTITVSTSGLITASVTSSKSITPTVSTGYVSTGTAGTVSVTGSKTQQLSVKAAATYIPTTSNQTISSGVYLTGTQTINGDANLVASNIKSGISIFGVTGTYSGAGINLQNTTITPTESIQTINPDSGYDGFSQITVNAIPSQYKNTSDANASAANILYNKIAYNSTGKVTGTMANNGTLNGTITSQGGTYIIPAGYTAGGTVTASFTATTLTSAIINGTAYLETTNDYGWKTTVEIPEGYHSSASIEKTFSSFFPAPSTTATAAQMLLGYQAYDKDGKVITGTMANNSYSNTLNDTRTSITIPAGYHDGTGTVSHTTTTIPNPTITVSTAGVITANGSWTKGYTTNNSYTNTKTLTTKSATTYTPGTSNQTIASGTYLIGTQTIVGDADLIAGNIKSGVNIFGVTGTYSGTLQTTAITATESSQTITPASGYNGFSSITVNAISSSYIGSNIPTRTSANATISGASITVASGYYSSGFTKSVATATQATPSISINSSGVITASATQTAGYVSAGTKTSSLALTTVSATTITPSSASQTAVAANRYTLGAITVAGDPDLLPENILSGVSIFGVTGNVNIVTYYSSSTVPSNSLGSNGDLYFQTTGV